MATRPNFFSSLQLPEGDPESRRAAREAGEELPGPVARGPNRSGDKLHWIYVWIIQNGDDMKGHAWAAAAYGEYPEEEHSKSSKEEHSESSGKRPPFEGESWEVPTEMGKFPGDDFEEGPAIATSMALVERDGESSEVYWWTEAVVLKKPEAQAP